MNRNIYEVINSIATRADRNPSNMLFSTFADEQGYLATVLKSIDNHIIYGRRGTGKTHAIKYLEGALNTEENIIVFLDLRTFGSESAYYRDVGISADRRAVKLFLDIFNGLNSEIKSQCKKHLSRGFAFKSELAEKIEAFESIVSETIIDGMSEFEYQSEVSRDKEGNLDLSLSVNKNEPVANGDVSGKLNKKISQKVVEKNKGHKKPYLNLRKITLGLREILKLVGQDRLWILFDEWATIPEDVQPYLADLIRRSIFPVINITVKIVAIDFRTNFMIGKDKGEYVGFELGADIGTSIDLDDFLVFENNSSRSGIFYSELLFNHYKNYFNNEIPENHPQTKEDLIDRIFDSKKDFKEFVRSAEGVPRDALNILSRATASGGGKKLKFKDILSGSRVWSRNDKESTLSTYPVPKKTFGLIRKHILTRKLHSRLILIKEGVSFDIIKQLIDLRVIHVQLKDYIVSNDDVSNYTIYSIDYGCYVNWLTSEIFEDGDIKDDLEYGIIPPISFKNLRSAILDVEEIESIINKRIKD